MNHVGPNRVTVVFACLIVATFATWWLGSGHSLTGIWLKIAVAATILIGFAKVYFIGQDFMELRHAPTALRTAFAGWVVVVGGVAACLYFI